MKNKDFNNILQDRLSKIELILVEKAKEYATEDRLHNFKIAGLINNMTISEALWGMATKHLVSIIDMVYGTIPKTEAMVDEKIGDMINYLILLEAVFLEELMKD
ncbi:MAG: hypothetical protein DRH93_08370 [Deltaproteobacteria bacterium]|nr:MAG: hypothetical protein DRH93_08370 [Deltaproteobacteria bacterium]